MKRLTYKCGCETYFEEKDGVYEVSEHGQLLCPDHATEAFHIIYYRNRVWARDTKWFGHVIMKTPMDMMILQEIINETKPDVIIETGTFMGGSALFMANMLDIAGKGLVYTVDYSIAYDENLPSHNRIAYFKGSSTNSELIKKIKNEMNGAKSVMVCLDSDHSKDNVLNEMEKYSPFVTVGNYMIVDDTNINNPMLPLKDGKRIYEQGPHEAVEEFIKTHKEFKIDRSREKFLFTFNPDGYLRKVSNA